MNKGKMKAILLVMLSLLVCASLFAGGDSEETGKIKAGFIYVGPIGDYGWSHAHDVGRRYVDDKYDWLETVYVEAVPEGDAMRFIDRLVQQEKCDIIFTTSFGYMDQTIAAGEKYPDTVFMHNSGYKTLDNVGTYMGDLYQMYYLNGTMAAALSKTDKIGYVAAFPIPELFRHIDAFALGIKAVNPDAEVHVKWTYAWYGPDKAREAAEALIAEGCDALAFTEDTPAVVEVGQEHTEAGNPVYTFSHYSPMQAYGEDSVVSGQLIDWGIMYEKTLNDLKNGTWTNERLWYVAAEGAALLGGSPDELINPVFIDDLKAVSVETPDLGTINAYDLTMKRYEQMKASPVEFEPYEGPVYDNEGNIQIAEGERPDVAFLETIMFFVDNVVGKIPSN
jgi:basic membrane protein A and related proteins